MSGKQKYLSLDDLRDRCYVDPNSGCWVWLDGVWAKRGYARKGYCYKQYVLHRLTYEMAYGPFDNALFVLHKCDVRPCINPYHLYLGTHEDNMADRRNRNRIMRGSSHHSAKLTDAQVQDIRQKLACGATQASLAAEYGVVGATINFINTKKTWGHLPEQLQK